MNPVLAIICFVLTVYVLLVWMHVLIFGFLGISPKFKVCLRLALRWPEMMWRTTGYTNDVVKEYEKNHP